MIGNGTSLKACEVVERQGQYQFRWQSNEPQTVSIYLDSIPGEQDPVAVVSGNEANIAIPADGRRHYFFLQPDHGNGVWLADRGLEIEGAANTRDFGGYTTQTGQQVRWGKLFRTGHLAALSDADHAYLEELNVNLICDFRRPDELQREPSRLDGIDLRVVHLPIHPGSSQSFYQNLQEGRIGPEQMVQFMADINREFVLEQNRQFAEVFRLMLTDAPQLLIHCAVGKDRTGFAAAMILSALGVSEELVVYDYLLSNQYLPVEPELARLSKVFKSRAGDTKVSPETLRPMLEVREEYLLGAFDAIKTHYGSIPGFLREGLGLTESDLAQLRAGYLYGR